MGTFRLGVQPEWANVEPAVSPSEAFTATLLTEDPLISLINRGYCVVPLSPSTQALYSAFYKSFQLFSAQDIQKKSEWAHVQFDPAKHTPNQYHGFSVVTGLKEQFMMRIGGKESRIPFPTTGGDLGVEGTNLYIVLDQLCRQLARGVLEKLISPPDILEKVLDPVGFPETWQAIRDSEYVSTGYLPPGYVSSSIMDNFHYHGWHSEPDGVQEKHHKRFVNNHSAHTDSGLLTVVVCSDEPALEVFDLQDKMWVPLEQCLHLLKASKDDLFHRGYATVFWGDSVDYLRNPMLKPCLHRVEKADGERFSVVYKQRTSPLVTAPRYQEDYELGMTQLQSLDRERSLRFRKRAFLLVAALGLMAKRYFFQTGLH